MCTLCHVYRWCYQAVLETPRVWAPGSAADEVPHKCVSRQWFTSHPSQQAPHQQNFDWLGKRRLAGSLQLIWNGRHVERMTLSANVSRPSDRPTLQSSPVPHTKHWRLRPLASSHRIGFGPGFRCTDGELYDRVPFVRRAKPCVDELRGCAEYFVGAIKRHRTMACSIRGGQISVSRSAGYSSLWNRVV